MAKPKWMWGQQSNANGAQKDQQQAASQPSSGGKANPMAVVSTAETKRVGLENFGNTCYANSVMQALYHCAPFRELLTQASDLSLSQEDTLSPLPNNHNNTTKSSPQFSNQSSSSNTASTTATNAAAPTTASTATPSRRDSKRRPNSSSDGNSSQHAASPSINGSSSIPSQQSAGSSTTANGTTPGPVTIPSAPPTLFSALRSLFLHISTQPADKGTVAPRVFIEKLKESNVEFRSTMHQDAHEFFNYLLNSIVEEVGEQHKKVMLNGNGITTEDLSSSVITTSSKGAPTVNSNSGIPPTDASLVHKLFEGVLTSETRCLTCENVSSRDESFLDLSIDIEQNSSVTACLRQFSASEMLCAKNKFFCDGCCDLQEAEKRMKIKKLPNVLALHLKRFKYQEDLQRYIKLTYRVAFPLQLKLFNTVDDMDNADRLYNLFGIVIHIGHGPLQGHYVSIIKTQGVWTLFDDDTVTQVSEAEISKYFGESNAGSAYVLFYQADDIDLGSLGVRSPTPQSSKASAAHQARHALSGTTLAVPTTGTSTPDSNSPSPLLAAIGNANVNVDDQKIGPTLPPGLGAVHGSGSGETSDQIPDPTLPNSFSSTQAGALITVQINSLIDGPLQQPHQLVPGAAGPELTVTPTPISIKVSGWNDPADGSGRNTTTNSTVPSTPTSSSTPSIPIPIPRRSGSSSPTGLSSSIPTTSPHIPGSAPSTNGKSAKGLFGLRPKMPSLVVGKSMTTAAAVTTPLTTSAKNNRMSANNLHTQITGSSPAPGSTPTQTQSVGPAVSGPTRSSPVPVLTVSEDESGLGLSSAEEKEKEKSNEKTEAAKDKPKIPERKPSSWFGNRGFKLGEKNKEKDKDKQGAEPPPPSPGFSGHARGQTTNGTTEDHTPSSPSPGGQPSSWFKAARRRPSDAAIVVNMFTPKSRPSTSSAAVMASTASDLPKTRPSTSTAAMVHSDIRSTNETAANNVSVANPSPQRQRRPNRNGHARSQSYTSTTHRRPASPPPPVPPVRPRRGQDEESPIGSGPVHGLGVPPPALVRRSNSSSRSTLSDLQQRSSQHGMNGILDPFATVVNGMHPGHYESRHERYTTTNGFLLVDEPGEKMDGEHSASPTSPHAYSMSPSNGLASWNGNHSVASSSVTTHSGGSGGTGTGVNGVGAGLTSLNGTTNGTSTLRKATRKLSLTAPRLGFVGKKDKEKENGREKEKDKIGKEREREKEKTGLHSPFSQFTKF